MAAFFSEFGRMYSSDSAYIAGLLLAFGLVGIFSSICIFLVQ